MSTQDDRVEELNEESLCEIARTIIDGNHYLTLATSNASGEPWASPVFYSVDGYRDFYWISSQDATHSKNLKCRPAVAFAILNSADPVGSGQAVYIRANAEELTHPCDEEALRIYPGAPSRGARHVTADQVRGLSPFRVYRARAADYSILCPRESGPCNRHGKAFDHRVNVHL
jgi:uncharacterized protein YhbP (UPF0306 family)